jgi:Uri superfamily endonuclease
MQTGIYQLLIHLPESVYIQIGRRGKFRFPRGYYVYTGSAKNGLQGRVKRHLRKEKKHFWHMDYLLDHASVKDVFLFDHEIKDECCLSQETLARPGAELIAPGFGSSDCGCPSHLVFFKRLKDVPLGNNRTSSFSHL